MSDAAVATPITKIEAVRQAMQKLGKDATRADLQSFVKEHFGYEMTTDHISNCKIKLQEKKKGKGKAKKLAATAPATGVAKATTAAGNGKSAAGIGLADIESVKGLVGRVGPDQLRSLVDLLAK